VKRDDHRRLPTLLIVGFLPLKNMLMADHLCGSLFFCINYIVLTFTKNVNLLYRGFLPPYLRITPIFSRMLLNIAKIKHKYIKIKHYVAKNT